LALILTIIIIIIICQSSLPLYVCVSFVFNTHRKKRASQFIRKAALLIAPVIEDTIEDGFAWVITNLQAPLNSIDHLRLINQITSPSIT